jgi:hypothetical protein
MRQIVKTKTTQKTELFVVAVKILQTSAGSLMKAERELAKSLN